MTYNVFGGTFNQSTIDSLLFVAVAADSTGVWSLYTTLGECEIMFHVSTLLPFTANNRQQVFSLNLIVIWCNSGFFSDFGTCSLFSVLLWERIFAIFIVDSL